MTTLYTLNTLNCAKVLIAINELGLTEIDIRNAQNEPATLMDEIAPDKSVRFPALVEHGEVDNAPVFLDDSNTILIFLAEREGRLLPEDPARRSTALQWLALQAGGFSAFLGEAFHYCSQGGAELKYPMERYSKETARHCVVFEKHLSGRDYVADEFSMADIAIYPWIASTKLVGIDMSPYPNVQKWSGRLAERKSISTIMTAMGADYSTNDLTAFGFPVGSIWEARA